MPIRFPRTELYPLPGDYVELTTDGQQMARINACSLQETPDDLATAWSFFRNWYLRDSEEAGFYPQWYKRFKKSPPVHYQMVRDIGKHSFNCFGVPRAFAKSTVFMELAMLLFLTRRGFTTLLVYPRGSQITDRFSSKFMFQFEGNGRIIGDFGRVKPSLGHGIWNTQMLTNATNRSVIKGMAVKGSMLGERPDLILPDDCEFDPQLQITTTELIDQMDGLMHNTILPMLDAGESAIAVLGTLHNMRTWIARWLHMNERDDPRVSVWNRRLYGAEDRNPDGTLLWEAKFDSDALELERIKLGPRAYAAQRLNQPAAGLDAVLPIDSQLGQYEVVDVDPEYESQPLRSNAKLVSYKKNSTGHIERVTRPFGEAASEMFRVMTVDYAACNSPTSDFVCFLVTGIERSSSYKDHWWYLDLFLSRVRGAALYRKLFQMALKWRVRYIGIEAVAAQMEVFNNAESYLPSLAERFDWHPRMFPLKWKAGLAKEDRILGLEWRHHQNRIKYPKHLRHKREWSDFFDQTLRFTGEAGCLKYDDALDTASMVQYLVKTGQHQWEDTTPAQGVDLVEMMRNGERWVAPGVPVAAGVPINEVPYDVVRGMIDRVYEDDTPKRRKQWIPTRRRK